MNDYGMSYDQVRHYLKQGKIQSQVINGDLNLNGTASKKRRTSATGHPKPQNYESHKNKYPQASDFQWTLEPLP